MNVTSKKALKFGDFNICKSNFIFYIENAKKNI
jgi:hypothetical protein